jgi:hypothetical protein
LQFLGSLVQQILGKMGLAPLPAAAVKLLLYGLLQSPVVVADDQINFSETAVFQPREEVSLA